jgi:hypothetical protein
VAFSLRAANGGDLSEVLFEHSRRESVQLAVIVQANAQELAALVRHLGEVDRHLVGTNHPFRHPSLHPKQYRLGVSLHDDLSLPPESGLEEQVGERRLDCGVEVKLGLLDEVQERSVLTALPPELMNDHREHLLEPLTAERESRDQ